MATSAVAAAIARARRNIQHHFFSADAVRPDRAIGFEPSRHIERRQFERMRARGVVKEAKPGLYWIDMVAYDQEVTRRFHRIRLALLMAILFFVIGLLIPVIWH